jgi:response regulator RpfG family c-di-GMP phosphodiesterase
MVCEDFLSRAAENFRTMHHQVKKREETQGRLDYTTKKLHEKVEELKLLNDTFNSTLMENEDFSCQIAYRFEP